MTRFRRRRENVPSEASSPAEQSATIVAAQVAHAADQLEAVFRQLQPVIDKLPAVITADRPTPGGRPS